MSEQGHERGQAHAGVDEGGAEGVAELVQGDVHRVPGPVMEPGVGDRVVEAGAESVCADAAAAFDEHEVGRTAVTRVGVARVEVLGW